jgi:hypothetical protein
MNKSGESSIRELSTNVDAVYNWSVGSSMERFYRALQEKRIIGVQCPKCKKVYVPPRMICEFCFAQTEDQIEVGPQGNIVSYTCGNISIDLERGGLKDQPELSIIALIKLDKADSCIVHTLKEMKVTDIAVGRRVEVVWPDETDGKPARISHFRPVIGEDKK